MKQKFTKGIKATMSMPVEVKSIDKENFTLTMVASTQSNDRHGDVVIQSGWDISMFKKNPVILNSHNYSDVTEIIAKATRTEVVGKGANSKLEQDWKFAVKENPKAKIIFDLYAGEYANASSVGFIPTKFRQNKDGSTDYYTIEEAELLEVSAVSVPANARALAKSKGIDVDVLEDKKDDDDKIPEDESEKPEGDDDALPEGDEVSPTDGDAPAIDGDGSESKPEASDEEAGADAGAPASDEVVPEVPQEGDARQPEDDADTEEEVVVPVQESYTSKVVKAIARIDIKEREEFKKVARIIRSLLDEDVEGTNVEKSIKEQVRKRKINQAIRSLLKTK